MAPGDPHKTTRRMLYAAVAFFAAVIGWVLWQRDWADMFWTKPPPSKPVVPMPAKTYGGDAAMPTTGPRMKIDRIEPRKYRRAEGSIPPPAGKH